MTAALFSVAAIASAANIKSVAAQKTSAQQKSVENTKSFDDYVRPYHAGLNIDLPKANQTPALDLTKPLSRIIFGSCNHHARSQHMWPLIEAQNPDLVLAIGDNIYGDNGYLGEADLGTFIDAYRLQASHPEFKSLRSKVPMLATWDDHDYGPNDSGGTFAFREWSETLFETFWGASDAAKSRQGVYDSVIAGPEGQRVQIIMLDTRFFRSPLKSIPYQESRPPLGPYIADDNPEATILGADQWAWLKAQLAKPADLRLVVSSTQVITDAHGFEKWGNHPVERERLFKALKARNSGDVLILSGDRHSAAFYAQTPKELGNEIWEFTSSSLNLAFVRENAGEGEPDARRRSGFFTQENYGMIDIDWQNKEITMQIRGNESQVMALQRLALKK